MQIVELQTLQKKNHFQAHNSTIALMTMNHSGTLLATASAKGTVVRLFSLPDAIPIATFRRGSYSATIFSIAFSLDSSLMAVSSDTGTIHIFKVRTYQLGCACCLFFFRLTYHLYPLFNHLLQCSLRTSPSQCLI